MSSQEEDLSVPSLPIFIEDAELVAEPHQLAREGLRFRAQVSGRTEHEQLGHDLGEMGCRVVSPDPDRIRGLVATIRTMRSK